MPETIFGSTRAIGDIATLNDINEGTAAGYLVNDIWVVEYDHTGVRIGQPTYWGPQKLAQADGSLILPVTLPTDPALTYKLVVIANTHREVFNELSAATTIENLAHINFNVTKESDFYNHEVLGFHDADLLMNGVVELTSEGGDQVCNLFRNVAKLTIEIESMEESDMTITGISLCNVPDRVFYADQLMNDSIAPFPTNNRHKVNFLMWQPLDLEASDQIIPGERGTFSFYLPRNMRGITDGTLQNQKNKKMAPDRATYVEVYAICESTAMPFRYTFYLGENMVNDYNVIPNHHYILPITINSQGDVEADPRVEDLGLVKLRSSNCYLINPLSTPQQQVFRVPTDRVELFWTLENGDNVASVSGPWVAEVIWQDQPGNLIHFCNEDGTIPSDPVAANTVGASQNGATYQGVGASSYFYFKPNQGAQGNVLIGVRKASENAAKNRPYLWSWHLWITDYDPDSAPSYDIWDNDYQYQLNSNSGRVLHYADAPGYNYWATTYSQAMIMDRNIGAMIGVEAPVEIQRNLRLGGLHYTYGRKDPFPVYKADYTTIDLYGIDGFPQQNYIPNADDCIAKNSYNSNIPNSYPEEVKFYTTVCSPYRYYDQFNNGHKMPYTVSQTEYYYNQPWLNPTWFDAEMQALLDVEGKTFFDPCPQGWSLPHSYQCYNIFSAQSNPRYNQYGFEVSISAVPNEVTNWFPNMGVRAQEASSVIWYGVDQGIVVQTGAPMEGFYSKYSAALRYDSNIDGISYVIGKQDNFSGKTARCVKVE